MKRGISVKLSSNILIIGCALFALAPTANAQGFVAPFGAEGQAQQPKTDRFAPIERTPKAAPQAAKTESAGLVRRTGGYRIGPSDVLEISVFGVPELSGQVEVSANGNIQLPLLGETPVAGKTPEELQQYLITTLGAEYLQNPQVRVTVKEFKSSSVTVSGAIGKPGIYQLSSETTLLQIVAMAGGFKDAADSTVLVLRNKAGKRHAARFDVSAIEKGRATDPLVQGGDTIVAGESTIKKTYQGFLKALPIAGAFALF